MAEIIKLNKEKEASAPVPNVDFNSVAVTKKQEVVKVEEVQKEPDQLDETISQVFNQAVVHTVNTDDEIKQDLLNTAKQVVTDKANIIKTKADTERKAAFFENNQAACNYFGYEEKTTNSFHVKVMAVWTFILNSLYIFTFGFFVISPITFILKKIKVIIRHTWLALLLAVLIYVMIIITPLLVSLVSKAAA